MVFSALARRCRPVVPVCAFLATAALAIVLAAQAQLACTREMTMTMPPMAGMDMTGGGVLMLCPIVLVLGIAAALLTANAFALIASDPHRTITGRALVRRYARLPFAHTAGAAIALGSGAVAAMMAVDGSTPGGLGGWLALGGIIVAVAVAVTVIALGSVRGLAALTRRIVVALVAELHRDRRAVALPAFTHRLRAAQAAYRVPLLAARRGLRAPPSVLR